MYFYPGLPEKDEKADQQNGLAGKTA